MSEEQIQTEINNLCNYLNDMALVLTFGLDSIKNYKNLYEIESNFEINMCSRADADRIKNATYDRLKPIVNLHEKFVRENFHKKQEVKKNVKLLSIVSFLVPLFMGLKRRMRIPDINNLLPIMTGEDVHTERELPPLVLGDSFKSQLFNKSSLSSDESAMGGGGSGSGENSSKQFFNLHGGIQFEIETCSIDVDCKKLAQFNK